MNAAAPDPIPGRFRRHVLAVLARRMAERCDWPRRRQLYARRDMFNDCAVWRGGGQGRNVLPPAQPLHA